MRGDHALMMTPTQTTLQQVMADAAVDTTLSLVATMTGLPKDTVVTMVESGLPMMAHVADADPWVFKAMYARSVNYLPPPTHAFYTKLGKNATARQALEADFQRMFGPMTETINRDVASHASAPEAQTRQVLAATMPAMVKAVGRANTNVNEMGFGRQLRYLQA
jgi:hypothetical protein